MTKTLIRHLKKTSQRYLRSVSKTLLRQLTKTFLRYLSDIDVFKIQKAYTHVCKLYREHFRVSSNQFLRNLGFLGLVYLIVAIFSSFSLKFFAIFQGPDFCLRIRQSFCTLIFLYSMINSILFTERQVSGYPQKSEKDIFQGLQGPRKRIT